MAFSGYKVGDYVPGKGIIQDDGTYKASKPGDVGNTTGDSNDTSETKKDGPSGIPYSPNWAAYGVTPEVWAGLNSVQQAQVSIVMTSSLSNYASSSSSLSVPDALAAAANDPTIISQYSDALKIDKSQLQSSLVDAQTALSTSAQSQKIQFDKDKKALAEASAAAGTAYSGFREQAKKNLDTTEQGIVTSTRSQTKQTLDQARQAFEAKYGTAATPSLNLNYDNPLNGSTESISGSTVGNKPFLNSNQGAILGSQNVAESTDLTKLAAGNIAEAAPVPITAIK